MRGVRSRKKL